MVVGAGSQPAAPSMAAADSPKPGGVASRAGQDPVVLRQSVQRLTAARDSLYERAER
jgi:hypothetical protein